MPCTSFCVSVSTICTTNIYIYVRMMIGKPQRIYSRKLFVRQKFHNRFANTTHRRPLHASNWQNKWLLRACLFFLLRLACRCATIASVLQPVCMCARQPHSQSDMAISVRLHSAWIICCGRSSFFFGLPLGNKAHVAIVFVWRVSHAPYLRMISVFLYRTHTIDARYNRDTAHTTTGTAKYIVWANGNTHNWRVNETATLIRHSIHQYYDVGQSERSFHRFVT